MSKITKLFSIVGEKAQGQKQVDQRLSAEGFQQPEQNTGVPVTVDRLLGPNLKAGVLGAESAGGRRADDMLLSAEESFKAYGCLWAAGRQHLGHAATDLGTVDRLDHRRPQRRSAPARDAGLAGDGQNFRH